MGCRQARMSYVAAESQFTSLPTHWEPLKDGRLPSAVLAGQAGLPHFRRASGMWWQCGSRGKYALSKTRAVIISAVPITQRGRRQGPESSKLGKECSCGH